MYKLYIQYRDNPTVTETELELNNEFQRPNFTICINGWPVFNDTIFWSPLGADFDSPAWPNVVFEFAKVELRQLLSTGDILSQKWTLQLWLYIEYYIKILSNIEQNAEFTRPNVTNLDRQMEQDLLELFAPYNVSFEEITSACAYQLMILSGCLSSWPVATRCSLQRHMDIPD